MNGAQEGQADNENDLSMTSVEDVNVDNNLMEGMMKQSVSILSHLLFLREKTEQKPIAKA